ncbi:lamin tail domain-containing protein [Puniceicoccaceae bacterium K14]|nr:lamin tail domain-containing protein [Puniceicoccaceae bacterium K14]
MNGKIWMLLLATISLCFSARGQSVVISEIVASNKDSQLDEDGESPDWVELHNLTDHSIDLEGWYLTDDESDLVKWRFPATEIAANGFLLVFASDKDRADAGSELHTNFKLSADGEQVLLVQPDGATVEHEVTFTKLEEDVAYGYTFEDHGEELVTILEPGAPCIARVPTSSFDASGWTDLNFSAAGWLSGTTGVGYDKDSDFDSLIGLDVESAISGVNTSIYIRVPFEVEDPFSISTLSLDMKYDDGFVAYINGVEVARSETAPSLPQWNSSADNRPDSQAVIFETFDLDVPLSGLRTGTNVLAIHGMNTDMDSMDLIFVPKLDVTNFEADIDLTVAGLLVSPSPGRPNSSISFEDFVETPVVSPERGFYETAFVATVSNATSGATIRFTLDGSEPTEESPEYTQPVEISTTTCFRVRAFRDGWHPSDSHTDTYIFVDDVAAQPESETSINGQTMVYGMDQEVANKTYFDASNESFTLQDALKSIPTISISTNDSNLYSPEEGIYVNATERWEVPASAELINPDGSEGFQINAGLRIREVGVATLTFQNIRFDCFFGKSMAKANWTFLCLKGKVRVGSIKLI